MRFRSMTVLVLAASAATLSAQTNDPNWRGWAYLTDPTSPRGMGMGGAFVAVADDASAVATNPAGMVTLPKTEIEASIMSRGSGTLRSGDTMASRVGVGYIGGSGRLTKRLAIGAFLTEPHAVDLTMVQPGPGGAQDTGRLNSTVTDAGVAVAWQASEQFSIGLRLNITHLASDGIVHRPGTTGYDAATAASQDQIAGDAGILFQPTAQFSIGAAFSQGARWDATRTSQLLTGQAQPNGTFQISSPSRFSGGVAYRPSPKILVTAQLDYVLLSRLMDTFVAVSGTGKAADYAMDDAVELRGGAEYSIPAGSVSILLRGGVASEAPAAFRYTPTTPATEALAFAGDDRMVVGTAGASLEHRRFRLDVGARFGGRRTAMLAGAAVKF